MLIKPAVLFETPADQGGDPPAAEPAPVASPPGDGPWADFLTQLPEDARGIADTYMRETVQPRITQLEQGQLPDGQRQFWDDFEQNPDEALLSLADEVYSEKNPDARAFFETALEFAKGDFQPSQEVPTNQPPAPEEPDYQELELDEDGRPVAYDPRVTEQQEDQAYTALLGSLQTEHPELIPAEWSADTLDEVLSPYIYAAEGDPEAALAAFGRAVAVFNPEPDAPLTDAQKAQLSAETNGVPTVQGGLQPGEVEPQYESIRDGVDAWLAESKAPPTV